MQLRDYQKEIIQEIRVKMSKGAKRVILCAPTGAGKTVIFSTIVARTLQKDLFSRVLILTDRVELCKQTFTSLDHSGTNPQIYDAKVKKDEKITSNCVVAMVETVKRRFKSNPIAFQSQLGKFSLIIIDEAHKGNFNMIFDIFPDSFFIGATATPLATSKKNPLKNFYDDISFTIDVPDLIIQGYLVQAKSYAMKNLYNESDLQYDSKKGDFTDKSLAAAFGSVKIYEGVKDAYEKHCQGKKTMIFCVNIDETIKVADLIPGAWCIHSKTNKKERDSILRQYHASKDGVLVNCGILTTGYDHPPIESIILNRATTSLPLFLQICGRGSRLSPKTGKEYFTIIDMGGNIDRLGLWEDERDWVTMFNNPPKKGLPKPAPVKECEGCGAMLPVKVLECKYCGHVHKAPEREYLKGEIAEVAPLPDHLKNRYIADLSPQELFELREIKKYKAPFIWRILRAKGEQALREYEEIAGYKRGWHKHQIEGGTQFTNFKIV